MRTFYILVSETDVNVSASHPFVQSQVICSVCVPLSTLKYLISTGCMNSNVFFLRSDRRGRGDRYDSMVSACMSGRLVTGSPGVSVAQAQRLWTRGCFLLCMHTELSLSLPGNRCYIGYHSATACVVQRATRPANEPELEPKQFLDWLHSGLFFMLLIEYRNRDLRTDMES